MRGNFVKVAKFLQENFPELQGKIEGENYPVPPFIEFLSHVVSIGQMVGLAWMVMGANGIFRLVGMSRPPAWALLVEQYGIQFGILLFLIMPQVVQRWTATGAFEIFLDGENVFSKLASGRFPNADELVGAIESAGLQRVVGQVVTE